MRLKGRPALLGAARAVTSNPHAVWMDGDVAMATSRPTRCFVMSPKCRNWPAILEVGHRAGRALCDPKMRDVRACEFGDRFDRALVILDLRPREGRRFALDETPSRATPRRRRVRDRTPARRGGAAHERLPRTRSASNQRKCSYRVSVLGIDEWNAVQSEMARACHERTFAHAGLRADVNDRPRWLRIPGCPQRQRRRRKPECLRRSRCNTSGASAAGRGRPRNLSRNRRRQAGGGDAPATDRRRGGGVVLL